ncbi:MAG TPA: pyridoxal-dependent decarboxylase [Paludibaculum sp.]
MQDANRLSPGSAEIRRMCEEAAGFMTGYYDGLRARRVMPEVSSAELRGLIVEPLPRRGMEFDALLGVVRDVIVQYSRHNGHPRFFGYVASPGTAVGAVGEMLTATLNANVTSWRSSPAAAEIEHVTVNWLKEMLGYPESALGLFVSGGSMANFSALAAARSAKGPADVSQAGLCASGRRMRVYVSEEAHFSSRKAAGLLGIGEANVVLVGTDGQCRMDVDHLRRLVCVDEEAGYLPLCVVGSAGTVSTGAFDPLAEIGAIAEAHNLWFHVDAAYGGFAALAHSTRALFRGIEAADSVTLDPHKWAYLPTGVGCVLYRDAAWARKAFAHDADYTRVIGHERDESFAFWDYGPELSRRFRALGLWLLLKHVGAEALGAAIEQNMACARYVEELVRGSDDLEMLAPVGLSVFCFRYAPKGFAGDLDALNERVLVELQRDGSSYLSNARVGGRFALRGCVLNYRTTARDMEVMVEDVRRVGRVVVGEA